MENTGRGVESTNGVRGRLGIRGNVLEKYAFLSWELCGREGVTLMQKGVVGRWGGWEIKGG